MRRHAVYAILAGGLVAGALDLTYATVFSAFRGVPAARVFQSVASGLLGEAAYEGGFATAVLGVCLHFLIMLVAAASYFVASRRFAFLRRRPLVAGAVFGVCMYAVMTFVVLPVSAFPHVITFTPLRVTLNLLVHMFLVGGPIAWAASRVASSGPAPVAALREIRGA